MKYQIAPLSYQQQQYQQQHYLTIEDIKSTRNSCWLCGCNWLENHVSLDCPECDGYALSRPCPNCDGKCEQTWTRNISATHDRHKALWTGQCKFQKVNASLNTLTEAERFKAVAQTAASMITTSKKGSTHNNMFSSPYQATKAPTTTTTTTTNSTAGSLAPSSSSCCSSQPSSATTSDEETDDLSSK